MTTIEEKTEPLPKTDSEIQEEEAGHQKAQEIIKRLLLKKLFEKRALRIELRKKIMKKRYIRTKLAKKSIKINRAKLRNKK